MLTAGVDEVGRGPLAGPVVAAAVILDPGAAIEGLRDSKCLTPAQRARLAREIRTRALCAALGAATEAEIDEVNILEASLLAMERAVARLKLAPERVLVDGRQLPRFAGAAPAFAVEAVVDGDASVPCIRLDTGQALPRPAHAARAPPLPGLRLRPAQGLCDGRAPGRARRARALRDSPRELRARR